MLRKLIIVAFVATAWLLFGCDNDREPMPVHRVVIERNGTYVLDGRTMEHSELLSELNRQAQITKREGAYSNRAIIRVILGSEVPYGNYERLTDQLGRLGFKNVELEP
jgi:biopolymer transport protein ExbD